MKRLLCKKEARAPADGAPVGLVVVHLADIDLVAVRGSEEPLAVPVGHPPEEVFVHVAEAVALARQDEHLEALVGADQGIDHADGVARAHVVVDVARHQHQVSLLSIMILRK